MTSAPFNQRRAYSNVRVYNVESPQARLLLADNTSAFGMPPSAVAAIRDVAYDTLASYPSTYSGELREALAAYVGVAPDEVVVTAGSDEAMSCAFRALAEPDQLVAHIAPTFVMTPVFAVTNSLRTVAVPLTTTFDADADALLNVGADVLYLCSPNNPTGNCLTSGSMARVLGEHPGLVILDEAYAEFSGTTLAREAPGHGRLLVLRTLSKAFGLAGMRVGYAVGARPLIAELEKARGPFAVTALSEQAALAAVRHDTAWVQRAVAVVRQSRDRFMQGLLAAGFRPLPSDANFVLVPVRSATAAAGSLLDRGILVRGFVGLPGIGDALRITVGSESVMQEVLHVMQGLTLCE